MTWKICVNCKKEFERYNKAKKSHSRGRVGKYLRSSRSITCSKKCSREYNNTRQKNGKES